MTAGASSGARNRTSRPKAKPSTTTDSTTRVSHAVAVGPSGPTTASNPLAVATAAAHAIAVATAARRRLVNARHDRCGPTFTCSHTCPTAAPSRKPDGTTHELVLNLPGHVNRINAGFALAAASDLGCSPRAVIERIEGIEQTQGRYGTITLDGHRARLLLAKNPASWLEMLDLVSGNDRELVLVVNSREADGADVSWLWDVDFDTLQGRAVAVAGDRALDLAVRLRYAGVSCDVAATVEDAVGAAQGPPPEVIANYTAFRDLFARSVRV